MSSFPISFSSITFRYDGPQGGSSALRSHSAEGTGYSSDDTASEDEGEMWNDRRASDQGEDEEEDMRKRENELKQELNMATLRCEELKRTMIETKSFIDPLHSGKPCNTILV
jgi:TATA-binding protein-associated factor Taf7